MKEKLRKQRKRKKKDENDKKETAGDNACKMRFRSHKAILKNNKCLLSSLLKIK